MALSLPVTLTPTKEKAYCFRLISLVVDGGTLVLRHRFDQLIPPNSLQNTLNDNITREKLNVLFKQRALTKKQWELLYPVTGQPCSSRFDVSLLTCLLKYICGLEEHSASWSGIPPSFDQTIEADIKRLKYFRNQVCHLESVSLDNDTFHRKWTKIEQVITRLGEGLPNLQQEIQNLKERSIDPEKEKNYQDIIAEWEKMDETLKDEIADLRTELQDNKSTVAQIQKTVEENRNSIQTLEQKQQQSFECFEHKLHSIQSGAQELSLSDKRGVSSAGTIASTMIDLYVDDPERDAVYVKTKAHTDAKEKFDRTGCLILSGLPGEGKTTMATKLISETAQKGFYRKLNCPADWKEVPLNNEKPITVFIDDIFGSGALNEKLLEGWSVLLPDIEKAVKARAVKAIITTRHYILKEAKEKLKHLKILRDDNVQVLLSCDLSDDERIEILDKHLIHSKKKYDKDLLQDCNKQYKENSYLTTKVSSDFKDFKTMIGFPEIVSLFVKNEHLFIEGFLFFSKPYLFFKKCIEEISLDKEKFLALILVWTRPYKKLRVADIEPPNISSNVKETVADFGFEPSFMTTETIRKSLKYHEDGFLRFDAYDGTFRFSHNSVKDMVGLVAGQEYKTLILQYTDVEFLKQYITTDDKKDDGLHIFIEQFRCKELIQTICKFMNPTELQEGKFKRLNIQLLESFNSFTILEPIPSELSIETSLLEHDCFNTKNFVKVFCESKEGSYMLSRPVESLPRMCLDVCCDLVFGETVAIYIPTLALIHNSPVLVKEAFRQNCSCIRTSDFLKSSMIIASHRGLKDVIKVLLQHGAVVDEAAIFLASAKGNNECLKYLLQNFSGNCTECPFSINGNSPLIAAAKKGATECINTLIRHDANVNYRNKHGWSALDKAVMYAKPESCKILLDNGANVSIKTGKFRRTPLHINADVGDISITHMLLKHGSALTVKDYRGHYPVHCAAFSNNPDIVDILLKTDTSKVTHQHRFSYGKISKLKGASFYHIAVLKESVKMIECLLQNNVCPNTRDFYGRTPLYFAVYRYKKITVDPLTKLLIEKYSPELLEQYTEDRQLTVIKKLCEHSDAHKADNNGYTPLHAAVHKGEIELVKLLAPVCDVNAQDRYGKTPLHTACDNVDFKIFKLLVDDYRADYRMRTKAGYSVFDILAKRTEWRNIRRRYQNNQRVTKYMVEYPRLRSFKEIFENKDRTFLEEATVDIVLSEHPNDIRFTKYGYNPDGYYDYLDKYDTA